MPKVLRNYVIKNDKVVLLSNEMVFPDLPIAVVDYGKEYKQPELIDTGTGTYEIMEHEDLEKLLAASKKEDPVIEEVEEEPKKESKK